MLFSLLMALTIVQASPESIFADSQWLQDPRVNKNGESLLEERLSPELAKDAPPANIHTLFRREITLKAAPTEALLYVTGDDYFQLYLNGEQAVEGPSPAYPSAHPYFWLEVTPFLREGLNTLGARTLYAGHDGARFHDDAARAGFLLALEITYADGSRERFGTDTQWRVLPLPHKEMPTDRQAGSRPGEHIEQSAYPDGWNRNGFDDSAWPTPRGNFQDHRFVLQTTPPLAHSPITPYEYRKLDQDVLLYDFGFHLCGRISVHPPGNAGETLQIITGNELKNDGSGVKTDGENPGQHADKIRMDGSGDSVSFLLPRTFRYVEIRGARTPPEIRVSRLHYPFDRSAVRFASDDENLEQLWALSRNGIQYGIQDQYLGVERPSYWGDAYIAARSHVWLTGDLRLLRKTLHDFQESLAWQPHIPTALFQDHTQSPPEHGLFIPLLLELYWLHGGDLAWVKELFGQALPELFRRFATYENEYGLLAGLGQDSLLSELPETARDGYTIPDNEAAACTFQNVLYYGALATAARLAEALDLSAAGYRAKARRIEKAFVTQLADESTGMYRDAPDASSHSLPVNALALHFGLTAGVDPDAQARQIIAEGLPGQMLAACLALEGLFEHGDGEAAYALLQGEGPRSWRRMIAAGASSPLSHWPTIQAPNRSWLAPESAAPIWILVERVMGLHPMRTSLKIAPAKIPDLPAMEFAIPYPSGSLIARFHPDEGYTIWASENLELETMHEDDIRLTVHQKATSAAPSAAALSPEDREHLLDSGWEEHVGDALGVWIDVDRQHFYILKNLEVVWDAVCATASKGTGSEAGSYKTPLGWHIIGERFGQDAAWGQVFRARQATDEIWRQGMDTEEDLVLTRVLWLEGLEPGKNLGAQADGTLVDSKRRYIYIHGTNGEKSLGRPSSHGCIRLSNDAVIEAFETLPSGVKVLISERTGESAERAVPLP